MEKQQENFPHWATVHRIAEEYGLKACIPAQDHRNRLCQGFLFFDDEGARQFVVRLAGADLPPAFFYQSPRLIAIRFVTTMYDQALYDGLRSAVIFDRLWLDGPEAATSS